MNADVRAEFARCLADPDLKSSFDVSSVPGATTVLFSYQPNVFINKKMGMTSFGRRGPPSFKMVYNKRTRDDPDFVPFGEGHVWKDPMLLIDKAEELLAPHGGVASVVRFVKFGEVTQRIL